METRDRGVLLIGLNDANEVVVNLPALAVPPAPDGSQHVVFSADQARGLAKSLLFQAAKADAESDRVKELEAQLAAQRRRIDELEPFELVLEPYDQWHEDYGPVLWFRFPICEPGYYGDPLTSDWPYEGEDIQALYWVGIDANAIQAQWEERFAALDAPMDGVD